MPRRIKQDAPEGMSPEEELRRRFGRVRRALFESVDMVSANSGNEKRFARLAKAETFEEKVAIYEDECRRQDCWERYQKLLASTPVGKRS